MIPKYRAWDNWRKKMSVVDRIYIDTKGVRLYDDFGEYWRDFRDIELMQSTDLKDYFGKELFEGDVIEWNYWDEFEDSGTAKIIFDKGMFKLLDVRTEKSAWDNLFDCIENCNVFLQGNIYENPEFLEDKK